MRDHLLFTFKFNLNHLESLVRDLTSEQMVQQPGGLVNHPAWTLCHLASAANYTGVQLGLESTFPKEWEEAAKTGEAPNADASAYPARDALLEELTKQHERVAEAVAKADPAIFAKEFPDEKTRKFFPTMGDFVDYLLSAHEANHIGQLAGWRRAMGLSPTAKSD